MLEPGTRVRFIGDTKQSTLQRGMVGTVERVGRRGVDVRFDGRGAVTTGVPAAALTVVALPSKARLIQVFSEVHNVNPLDVVALTMAAIEHDNATIFRLVHQDAAPEYTYHAQLGRICRHDAVKCLVVLWPRRPNDALFIVETAASPACFVWVSQRVDNAALNEALRVLAARAVNGYAGGSARRVLVHMVSEDLPLEPDVADTLFRVFRTHSHAEVRDAVLAVLTRRGRQHDWGSGGDHEACVICAGNTTPPVMVFTAGKHVSHAGTVCFDCVQRSTAVRDSTFGQDHVFITNTTGQTLFMLNREPILFLLYKRRLYTYKDFTATFNQAGIGLRYSVVHAV